MQRSSWGARFLVCVLAAAVVGCSGGQDGAPGGEDAGPVVFDEEFTAVTAAYQADMEAVQERGRAAMSDDPKAVAAVFEDLVRVVDDSRERYERLDPPEDVATVHSQLVENLKGQSEALNRVVDSTRQSEVDNEALQELAVLLGEFATTQQLLAERLAQDG